MEIKFPFQFMGGAVVTESDLNNLATQHLYVMVATWESERVMLPTYGGPFRRILFDPADETTVAHLIRVLMDAATAWNLDLEVTEINRLPPTAVDANTIALDIYYKIVKTGVVSNTTVETDGFTIREVTV